MVAGPSPGGPGQAGRSGQAGYGAYGGAGGVGGNGGGGGTLILCDGCVGNGGGGTGVNSSGGNGAGGDSGGGGTLPVGGIGWTGGSVYAGGYGGGGGGGYSGGGGGTSYPFYGGGGGGSYLAPAFTNQVLLGGVNYYDGYVSIDPLSPAVPEPSTWAMMLLGFVGLGFLGYRKANKGRGRRPRPDCQSPFGLGGTAARRSFRPSPVRSTPERAGFGVSKGHPAHASQPRP